MGKDILAIDAQLPAHLRNRQQMTDEWGSGQSHGFPVLSIRGKVFHTLNGDDAELVVDPDTGEQATGVEVVVLKTHQGTAKVYYDKQYEEGDADSPTCFSLDGITPSPEADDRQAKKCAICPHNQWGSRITDSGSKGKACSDQKRLAVAAAGTLDEPMLLRLPPMSLKPWDAYVKQLVRKGVTPADVVTRISFVPDASYPQLKFMATGFVTEDMIAEIAETMTNPAIDSIVGSVAGTRDEAAPPPPEDDDDDEDEAPPPPPKKKAPAKRKAAPKKTAPKKAPEPEPEPEKEEDSGDDELDDLDDLDFDDIDFGDDD